MGIVKPSPKNHHARLSVDLGSCLTFAGFTFLINNLIEFVLMTFSFLQSPAVYSFKETFMLNLFVSLFVDLTLNVFLRTFPQSDVIFLGHGKLSTGFFISIYVTILITINF